MFLIIRKIYLLLYRTHVKIVVLKDGHVAETGNPEELKKQNGLFCQMMKRQVVRA